MREDRLWAVRRVASRKTVDMACTALCHGAGPANPIDSCVEAAMAPSRLELPENPIEWMMSSSKTTVIFGPNFTRYPSPSKIPMDLRLQNQCAIVIGSAQGIGRAIAESFAAEGARIGLIDLDPAVSQTAKEISAAFPGSEATATVADVASENSMRAAADALNTRLGPARHVVFAAGAGSGKFGFPFTNLDPADWPRVLEINLMGAVHSAHAFSSQLIEGGEGGSFLLIASVAGQIGSPTDPPYSAAKAAQINFMQCLARDFAPHGIRANALSPGMVRTTLNRAVWTASQRDLPESEKQDYDTWAGEKIRRTVPLGRWQEPADFGAAAVFLASPLARNITGQTLNIDGGQVMHS
jgi:2-hydroxycyclohexanecarboxyl-CoA dehydrogenase